MNFTHNGITLVAASVAIILGVGTAGCDKAAEYSSADTSSDSVGAAVSDTAITTQVEARLAADRGIASADIDVTTANGVVTLAGSVSDEGVRSAAERTARSVAGVRNVYNTLDTEAATGMTVAGTEQATMDTWITTKVKSVLLADSISKGFDVSVKTTDGVVALEGALKDQQAIDHVGQVAAGVEHVASVDTSALTIRR